PRHAVIVEGKTDLPHLGRRETSGTGLDLAVLTGGRMDIGTIIATEGRTPAITILAMLCLLQKIPNLSSTRNVRANLPLCNRMRKISNQNGYDVSMRLPRRRKLSWK